MQVVTGRPHTLTWPMAYGLNDGTDSNLRSVGSTGSTPPGHCRTAKETHSATKRLDGNIGTAKERPHIPSWYDGTGDTAHNFYIGRWDASKNAKDWNWVVYKEHEECNPMYN